MKFELNHVKAWAAAGIAVIFLSVSAASAQDTRQVTEPKIPSSCTMLNAQLRGTGDKSDKLADSDESKLDTTRIQKAIDGCKAGQAVELKSAGANNAFLTGPLELHEGVTLLIDKGVTLCTSTAPPRKPRSRSAPAEPAPRSALSSLLRQASHPRAAAVR
jgi:polygalacturonase